MVEMLKSDFVPVAIDQWYTRRQKDTEGEFYQSIAKQGPRNDMQHTTQGLYVCDAAGKLFGYNNNRHTDPIKKIMREAIESFDKKANSKVAELERGSPDIKHDRTIPEGTVVVRVNSKILGGYEKPDTKELEIFQTSIARDNLWILAEEKQQLLNGTFPDSLATRIARFHFIDNTRGEPPMWNHDEVKSLEFKLDKEGSIIGTAKLETADGGRSYDVAIRGVVKSKGDSIEQFDLVAKGQFFGDGPYTKRAPKGKFPLAIAFRLADGSENADRVAPQGSKGWLPQYTETK
jgi:hypothetical protein